MESFLDKCTWPTLPAPYDAALREAVAFVLSHYNDVQGIILCGSVLRGKSHAGSDLDLYVIRQRAQRQRLQRYFQGVPVEIFLNPKSKILEYLATEREAGQPVTAHMLSTGFVILELSPVVQALRESARQVLSLRPDPSPERLTAIRYGIALRYEDALDLAPQKPAEAAMLLDLAVYDMLHYRFWSANRYLPREKALFDELSALDTELASLGQAFYTAATLEEKLDLAHTIAEKTIGVQGFFEWDSTPEEV